MVDEQHHGRAPDRGGPVTVAILVTLALLAAVSPLAADLYLPAFPAMMVDLRAPSAHVQLSLTAFLAGVALGQAVFGPLSDRYGRMPPLLIGTAVYLAASVAAALAPGMGELIGARFLQGLSGAAGMVIGRAIISDLARGKQAARAFSLTMLVGGVAPVLGPLAGSSLVRVIGWRGLLWIVAGLGAISLVFVLVFLRETHPARSRPDRRRGLAVGRRGRLVRALFTRAYLGNALTLAFAFCTMMAYISASPFVYQTLMGLSEVGYGLAFGANALVLTIGGSLSARLVIRHSERKLAWIGLLINFGSIIALVGLSLSDVPPIIMAGPILAAIGSLGLVFGNTTALALETLRKTAGSGSAVLGVLQFALAGLAAWMVGIRGESTAVPMAITMALCSSAALVAFATAGSGARR
ncbi:MAG: multidrug effflux MFS transporter [Bifidobacteriaceae bacterium]|nr:multidrug effflux MFS transporter [Bifidobacteriaceae bacterium]